MYKRSGEVATQEFIKDLAGFIVNRMRDDSYVVINDINLWKMEDGPRDYFDWLLACLNQGVFRGTQGRYHFLNNKGKFYRYGVQYPDNKLRIDDGLIDYYKPYLSCSSAQLIIKKGVNR